MNELKDIEGEKETTLFGGRGIEKTLNWLSEDFTGYLKINEPEKSSKKYLLFLDNKEINYSLLKIEDILFFGTKILEKIKELLKKDDVVIEAFLLKKEKIIDSLGNLKQENKEKFSIKDVNFPKGEYLTTANEPSELKQIFDYLKINGYGVSREKKAAIIIQDNKITGGIYQDRFGTLKRENSVVDIKQSFPFDIYVSEKKTLEETSRTIRFKEEKEFWETADFPGEDYGEKRKIGKLSLTVKNQDDDAVEDATVNIRKSGKKISYGQTTQKGKLEKKLSFGEYLLWIKKEGYEAKRVDLKLEKEFKEKTVFLKKSEKVILNIQILTKDQKPVQSAKIEFRKGLSKEFGEETDKQGMVSKKVSSGSYGVHIEKEGVKSNTKVELDEKKIGEEKKIKIILPVTYRGLIEMINEHDGERNGLIEKSVEKNKIVSRILKFFKSS